METLSGDVQRLGRYEMHGLLASGGMAAVHLGRLRGDAGFARPVAIKRLHAQFANDPDFVSMLLDEAHLASRLQHPNCVAPRDVVVLAGEVFVVMDYVHGVTLSQLIKAVHQAGVQVPLPIVCRIVSDVLAGLHAAHRSVDAQGRALELVHRDVSPQNVIVGSDGLSRVIDFGIAQAAFRSQTTRDGQIKGKLAYAAPEQVADKGVSHLVDVYAAGVVCWELATLRRLFTASNTTALYANVVENSIRPMRPLRPEIPLEFERTVMAALAKDPAARPADAEVFSALLEAAVPPASAREVARFVELYAGELLERRNSAVRDVERSKILSSTPAGQAPAQGPALHESLEDGASDHRTVTIVGATRTSVRSVVSSVRRRRLVGAGAAALVALLLVAMLQRRGYQQTPARVTAGSPVITSMVKPQAAQTSSAEVWNTTVPAANSSSASATVPVASSARARSTSPVVHAVVPHPKTEPNCSSLYETDSSGIRRVKRECLRKLSQP